MFELGDFYAYCKANQVHIIPYQGAPSPGTTIRDRGAYGIFLDFSQIPSLRKLRGICCHEMGHTATGALHKISSPYELVERAEYRANRWTAEHYLTVEDFQDAFGQGYTELWELAEYFDLPAQDIQKALAYWTVSKGIQF